MRAFALLTGVVVLFAGAASACILAFARSAAAVTSPRCATSRLVLWLNTQGDHAAGSIYYTLAFTNLSGRLCTLRGVPGVSAVGLSGRQLGKAAARSGTGAPRQARLANGASAVAVLQLVNVHNFPRSACRPVIAAGLRVYPPGSTASKVVPFPFAACSGPRPVYLLIRAVRGR